MNASTKRKISRQRSFFQLLFLNLRAKTEIRNLRFRRPGKDMNNVPRKEANDPYPRSVIWDEDLFLFSWSLLPNLRKKLSVPPLPPSYVTLAPTWYNVLSCFLEIYCRLQLFLYAAFYGVFHLEWCKTLL